MRGNFYTLPHAFLLRKFFKFSCAIFIAIALSSCTFVEDKNKGGKAPPPTGAEKITPPPTAMDTFRALAPPEGMKFTPMFAEQIDDPDSRFARLENAVQTIRNDFDTVTPSLVRLVAIEKDIKKLVGQLQTLTTQAPAVDQVQLAPPPAPVGYMQQNLNKIPGGDIAGGTGLAADEASGTTVRASPVTPEAASEGELPPEGAASPISKPAMSANMPLDIKPASVPLDIKPSSSQQPTPTVAPPPAKPAGPVLGDVKNIRIGDHLDKTRIVLDMTAAAAYTARLENDGRRLVIDLPQMGWSTTQSWDADTAPLVASYRYENGKLILDLLYSVTIKSQSILPPNGSPYHRLVVDVFSKEAHEG